MMDYDYFLVNKYTLWYLHDIYNYSDTSHHNHSVGIDIIIFVVQSANSEHGKNGR